MKTRYKTILISILTFTILVVGFHIYLRLNETSEDKTRFHVFEYSNKNLLNSYLRKIPNKYDGLIKIERTDRFNKEYNLYKVDNDIYGGTPSFHYLVFNKDNWTVSELKSGSLLKRIKNPETFDTRFIYSYLIDLNKFNYVYSFPNIEEQTLIDNYARLLSNINDSIHFRKINSKKDIDLILKNYPQNENNMRLLFESELLDNYDFLDSINEYEKYYWFYDKGIIRFKYDFNETGGIEHMETYKIGYLGNEVVHI